MLISYGYPAQTACVGDDLFQIRADNQARAFAIDSGNAIVERRCAEVAGAFRNLFDVQKSGNWCAKPVEQNCRQAFGLIP